MSILASSRMPDGSMRGAGTSPKCKGCPTANGLLICRLHPRARAKVLEQHGQSQMLTLQLYRASQSLRNVDFSRSKRRELSFSILVLKLDPTPDGESV
jgi:hypothetical protein